MAEQLEKKRGRGISPLMNTVIFIVFALLVVGLLYSVSGERSPRIPEDENHTVITDAQACLACHGPGMVAERKPTHPPKDQCLLCHKVKRNRQIKSD